MRPDRTPAGRKRSVRLGAKRRVVWTGCRRRTQLKGTSAKSQRIFHPIGEAQPAGFQPNSELAVSLALEHSVQLRKCSLLQEAKRKMIPNLTYARVLTIGSSAFVQRTRSIGPNRGLSEVLKNGKLHLSVYVLDLMITSGSGRCKPVNFTARVRRK